MVVEEAAAMTALEILLGPEAEVEFAEEVTFPLDIALVVEFILDDETVEEDGAEVIVIAAKFAVPPPMVV